MDEKTRIYTLIKEAFILLDSGDSKLFARHNLTVPRYYALHHLAQEPGISFSALSNRMICDKSNVTRIIKSLETANFVCRKPHETDGRSLRLFLTETGTAVFDQVSTAHHTYNETRLSCLENLDKDNLLQGLTKIRDNLTSLLVEGS